MKRVGFYVCGFITIQFCVIIYLATVSRDSVLIPLDNPILLNGYPCKNTADVAVWFEPGLPVRDNTRYYVYINKTFPAHSVTNVTFDAKVNVTFTVRSDEKNFSKISLTGGTVFTLRFFAQQNGLALSVQGITPGLTPNLSGLTINDVEYCDGPDMGFLHKYTKIENASQEEEYQWQAESHIPTKGFPRDCGRRIVDSELTVDGEAKPGAWPWFAAIYDQSLIMKKYYCAGTLVSKNLVLTAGHCTAHREETNLIVMLGKYDFLNHSEKSVVRNVNEIMTPMNYEPTLLFNDIALLKFTKEVSFTDYIQPACLWHSEAADTLTKNITGTIVGWGYDDDDQFLKNLQQANMPLVSDAECVGSNPDFGRILNGNNFCAGFQSGTSVCKGDSGIGYLIFVPDLEHAGSGKLSGSWHVRGVLSNNAVDALGSTCKQSYVVFTDVNKFQDWLLRIMDDL